MNRTVRSISLFLVACSTFCMAGSGAGGVSIADSRDTRPGPSIQAILRPETAISTLGDSYRPAVAYNDDHDEYLVVWHNVWPSGRLDIYARRVSAQGEFLSWFAVATGTESKLQPAVAYNSNDEEYLVVWMFDVNGDGSVYDIWGRVVGWNGSYMGPEFEIITWQDRSFSTPRVAWNSVQNEYLVIWKAGDTTTALPVDASSMRLGPDGEIIPGRVLTTSTHPQQADVVYNPVTDEYLVVFVRANSPVTTGHDIYGLRVVADNYVIDPPGAIAISTAALDQNQPAVATNGRFSPAVVWESLVGSDYDIYARILDHSGNTPWGSEFPLANSTHQETLPAVASTGSGYLTVWEHSHSDILALYWDTEPSQLVAVTPTSPSYCGSGTATVPAIAAGVTRFLITYEGDSSFLWPECRPRLFGRLWSPYEVFLPLVVTDL